MNISKIQNRIIQIDAIIISALKQMDVEKAKLLFVYDKDTFISIITIGDIQRAIINNYNLLQDKVKDIVDKNKVFCRDFEDISVIKDKMLHLRAECMPILDDDGNIKDIIFWENLFDETQVTKDTTINLPVVIMAGGKGSRLSPLTNVLPKPLVPINDKTIIENIMDRFTAIGCNDFHISVNYKAEMMKYYLASVNNGDYNISFFQEPKPLGTAGSLNLLKDKIKTTFFVSNCDIIIDENYAEIYKYHKENQNEITLVAAIKYLNIPYGTIVTKEDGLLSSMEEKPEFVFKINAGLYILEPQLLNEIPQNEFYHITELIEKLRQEGRRVGVFPVSEKSWSDIGTWSEYNDFIISHKIK